MGEIVAVSSCFNRITVRRRPQFSDGESKAKLLSPNNRNRQCRFSIDEKRPHQFAIKCQISNPSTYSCRISTDIPLYEAPGASFDQYLEDKPRVFKAIFPDKRRSQLLNEEQWRIHMLPIQFLFLTVLPVVDMRLRCKSNGIDYPRGVPRDITKLLELDIIRWELQGLDEILKPSQFSLGVRGELYPDRRGIRSRLKGQLQMTITFDLPPVLALVPEAVRRDVAELVRISTFSKFAFNEFGRIKEKLYFGYGVGVYGVLEVLKRLVENMKEKVNSSLLADYGRFKREKPQNVTLSVGA